MRKLFKSYQTPTTEEFKGIWEGCLFVLDANVLLSLYRYSESTRDELLGILKNYKDRIWIPYQVGLEFSRNRVKVILDQTLTYDQLTKAVDGIISDYCKTLDEKCSRHPFIDSKALKKQFSESMEAIKQDISDKKQNHPDLMRDDQTLESINELFENNVGEAYEDEELKSLYKDAEARYKEKIPPGYEDSKKKTIANLVII